ncbi:MAG: aminotransferase class IV [Phycisphaerae bacterium]|nr:aminotransferase class IV [Phycisphaerae bacterium]
MTVARNVYINGEIVPESEARVSPGDAGFLLGAGIFETMRAYGCPVFRLGAHLARLRRGAEEFGIDVVESDEDLRSAIAEVMRQNDVADARLRLTATRGPMGRDLTGEGTPERATVVISAVAVVPYPDELYARGMTVIASKIRVNESDPTTFHKTTNYLPRLLALKEAHEAGCGEALMFNSKNHVAECATSNIFFVCNGRLLTPPVSEGLLPGITRQVVLKLAAELDIPAEEKVLVVDDLLSAEEIFLTNSIMELMPVCRFEQRPVGREKRGPVTGRLAGAYKAAVEKEQSLG